MDIRIDRQAAWADGRDSHQQSWRIQKKLIWVTSSFPETLDLRFLRDQAVAYRDVKLRHEAQTDLGVSMAPDT